MSDHDRYSSQSEAPLTFDARRSSGPPERPRSGLLLISAIILVVLIVAFAVFALNHVGGGGADAPTTIETMKAPADGAPATQSSGLTVETAPAATVGTPTFAPLPEQPQARPVAGGPVAAQPVEPSSTMAPVPAKSKDPIGDKIAAVTGKTPPPAPAKPAPSPATVAKAEPVVAPKTSATTTAPVATGTSVVQIGAFSSQALADQQWSQVAMALPADMVGKVRRTETVQVNGQTMYRALIGGFSTRADADAFCGKMKAQGRDCYARN